MIVQSVFTCWMSNLLFIHFKKKTYIFFQGNKQTEIEGWH